ncbi:hypothetical protein SAMN05660745_01764 [Corynebacterium glucuronolyticum]|nr:hypothetical protein CGLUCO_00335 [Corynebacterium glucuronolyticum DSM 44120]SMB86848.1 hypothetical protein SAMN05660745_01764 [Corynebacterium glucuronolyticum]
MNDDDSPERKGISRNADGEDILDISPTASIYQG